jgi:hypothetical protein
LPETKPRSSNRSCAQPVWILLFLVSHGEQLLADRRYAAEERRHAMPVILWLLGVPLGLVLVLVLLGVV